MKKCGFTLAEILLAMALVGVIAAMTVPTFVTNTRNKANASRLATMVSALNTGYTSMMVAEAAQDLVDTPYYLKFSNSEGKEAIAELAKYVKISAKDSNVAITESGAEVTFEYKDIEDLSEDLAKENGIAVVGTVGLLKIDVNGEAKPNREGRDIFQFCIGKDGNLYPTGGKMYSLLVDKVSTNTWSNEESDYNCDKGTMSLGCTARLIEEGYEIKY